MQNLQAGLAWSEAETAVRAIQLHFNLISRAWKGTLSMDVYFRSIGALIDVLLSVFLEPVLKADDISEAASQFIGSLFRSIQLQCVDLFSGDKINSSNDEANASNIIIAQKHCSVWDRFATVGDILQMSLSDIQDGLSIGKFVSITCFELSHLIMATFDDSEKRRNLLHALAAVQD